MKQWNTLFAGAVSAALLLCASAFAAEKQQPTKQWPFDRLPEETLRSMKKKVFAHYFSQFPISIDDRDPANDYYQKGYLHPDGENGKHRAYGHFINQRPIPRLPRRVPDWAELDRYDEVRMAAETGMDGFAYNILSTQGRHWTTLLDLMKQVKKYGKGFSILIMPDMTAEFKGHPERMVPALLKIANDPSLFRIDGKLVIAPYNAYAQSPEWWKDRIAELKQNGVDVLFIPGFQGWWKYLKNYKDLSIGFFDWGTSTLDEQVRWRRKALAETPRYGKFFMAPVRPQDCRPRAGWSGESRGSELFREMWKTAMDYDAGMVQLITWSDYSEGSEIAPSTGTRWAFYDLTAYYTSWFKTGKQPKIVRDAIYYFHRIQSVKAKHDPTKQKKAFRVNGPKAYDEIELLGFLKAPGILRITLNGKTHEKAFPAGIHKFQIPLEEGRPEFSLVRNGKEIIKLKGNWDISNKITYSNLLYHADGGTAEAPRTWNGPKKVETKPILGKLIRKIDLPVASEKIRKNVKPVLPSAPLSEPLIGRTAKGNWVLAGGGKGAVTLAFSDPLPDDSELIFYVNSLKSRPAKGWVAFFLNAGSADGKTRFGLTPRNEKQTYVSAGWPGTPFKVVRDNFEVEYPAIYRIRRADGKLSLFYGNYPVYTIEESKHGKTDRISLYIGTEKPDGAGLLEIGKIELRAVPDKK